MSETDRRWREIQDLIREVLLRDWDPIGVGDIPEARDEYDDYIGGIYSLICGGAPDERIAEHLLRIETETIGGSGSPPQRRVQTIARLRALDLPGVK